MRLTHKAVIDFVRRKPLHIEVTKNNANTTLVEFFPYSNGVEFEMDEVRAASVKAVTPSGIQIFNDAPIVNDRITYTISETIMGDMGETTAVLQLYGEDDRLLNSFEFVIVVYPSLFDEETLLTEDDLAGFRTYMARAEKAAEGTEDYVEKFQAMYGTVSELEEDMEEARVKYLDYFTEFKREAEAGLYNGERGIQGENGADAIVSDAGFTFGFQIVDGDLICYYTNDEVPPYKIDDDGYLYMEYGEENGQY